MLPVITTQNLILRPPTITDAHAIFAYASRLEVAHFTQWEQHTSLQQTIFFIQHCHKQHTYLWVIEHTSTNSIIGECGIIQATSTTAELHCALLPAWWGKSIAYESLQALIAFCFTELSYTTMQACIITDNTRSQRLAHKLGLVRTTTLHNYWFAHNQFYDVELYTLAKSTWIIDRTQNQQEIPYHPL